MNTLKTLAISAALVVGTLGAASASSLYSSEVEFPGSYIEFGVIVADAPATLALYDYTGGVKGELISTVNIDAGYNSDVRIQTKSITVDEVQAELSINGTLVDSYVFDHDDQNDM
ncbi:hypothetical protein [Celeribacter sp.]|uniref:hypothetical protein n=1 Tax=Celeribacter sp. TaxID=1890673 RepID=UPI003A8DC46C